MNFNGQPNMFFGMFISFTCDPHLKLDILNLLNIINKLLGFGNNEFCNLENNSFTNPFVHQCVAQTFSNINIEINLLSSLPTYRGTSNFVANLNKCGSSIVSVGTSPFGQVVSLAPSSISSRKLNTPSLLRSTSCYKMVSITTLDVRNASFRTPVI